MFTGDRKVGELSVTRGTIGDDNKSLVSWDVIRQCRGEDCPLVKQCKYKKIGFCSVELKYMRAVWWTVMKEVAPDPEVTELQLLRLGLTLIPLYGHLVKFKMEECCLDQVCLVTDKGVKVHPIYKEIRETMKTIERIWGTLSSSVGNGGSAPDPDMKSILMHGDPDGFYEYEDEEETSAAPPSEEEDVEGDEEPKQTSRLKRRK